MGSKKLCVFLINHHAKLVMYFIEGYSFIVIALYELVS